MSKKNNKLSFIEYISTLANVATVVAVLISLFSVIILINQYEEDSKSQKEQHNDSMRIKLIERIYNQKQHWIVRKNSLIQYVKIDRIIKAKDRLLSKKIEVLNDIIPKIFGEFNLNTNENISEESHMKNSLEILRIIRRTNKIPGNLIKADLRRRIQYNALEIDCIIRTELNDINFKSNTKRWSNNLSQIDLSYSILVNSNFSSSRMNNSHLKGCNLRDSNFSNSYLEKSDLSESNLARVKFRKARLAAVDLANTNLYETDFTEARLFKANFEGNYLNKTKFISSRLSKANFRNTRFRNVEFKGADLDGVDFREANISDVDFSETNFLHIDLLHLLQIKTKPKEEKKITIKWKGALFNNKTKWPVSFSAEDAKKEGAINLDENPNHPEAIKAKKIQEFLNPK